MDNINYNRSINLVEDGMSIESQGNIEDQLLSSMFPWHYQKKSTSIKYNKLSERESPYFSHIFNDIGRRGNDYYTSIIKRHFSDVFKNISSFYNASNVTVYRSKCNFYKRTNNIFEYRHLPLHVDLPIKHIVIIYYVNDSDGKTVFKNGEKVSPKRGRLIFFDGSLKHSMFLPRFYDRLAINIDVGFT